MELVFVTLFVNRLKTYLNSSLIGKMIERGDVSVRYIDLRDFGIGRQKQVDDYPFSEQKGMLIRAEVLEAAIKSVDQYEDYAVLYMSPKGKRLGQQDLNNFKNKLKKVILVSGFYEGVDHRFFDLFNVLDISIGDYVLSSGDLPALVVAEGLLRLMPSYSKEMTSIETDSFVSGLLEARAFTRPEVFEGHCVPDVLLSGHHQKVSAWKQKDALKETVMYKASLLGPYFDQKLKKTNQANKANIKNKQVLAEVLKELSKGE